MVSRHTFQVRAEHDGLRLDQAISAHLPEVSRTLARKVLREGGVFVDKKRVKIAARTVRPGQRVEIYVSLAARVPQTQSAEVELPIVRETDDYVVVDKPSGMFSAPTPATDQRDVLAYLTRQSQTPNGELFLVHRLDRPTSGLMVVAKSKSAAAHLSKQVASRTMKRRYEAFLFGSMESATTAAGSIEGKEAQTDFAPLASRGPLVWVSAELKTGRTHQVRIHAEELGAPICGDSKYGRSTLRRLAFRPPRLCLHAAELRFLDPTTNELVRLESPLPPDLLDFWERLPDPDDHC